jgi:hypothetical protein
MQNGTVENTRSLSIPDQRIALICLDASLQSGENKHQGHEHPQGQLWITHGGLGQHNERLGRARDLKNGISFRVYGKGWVMKNKDLVTTVITRVMPHPIIVV